MKFFNKIFIILHNILNKSIYFIFFCFYLFILNFIHLAIIYWLLSYIYVRYNITIFILHLSILLLNKTFCLLTEYAANFHTII